MPKDDWKKNTVKSIFTKEKMWPWKDNEIVSILDLACGLSLKSKYIPAKIRVGVDIYEKYFDHIESDVPYVVIKYDVRKIDEIILKKSFDLVLAIDIIEHLEKKESMKLIKDCEKIARKGVILETPDGYIPQNLDIQGHGGHKYQTHRCGWSEDELKRLGYTTLIRSYTMSDKKRHTKMHVSSRVDLIDAIKIINY